MSPNQQGQQILTPIISALMFLSPNEWGHQTKIKLNMVRSTSNGLNLKMSSTRKTTLCIQKKDL